VSDSFQLAKSLLMLVLEELERYLVDMMMTIEFSEEERKLSEVMLNTDKFPVYFSEKYLKFLVSNKWSEGSISRQYCCNFVIMARKFRLYWNAIQMGDKLVQESIFCSWIGVFSLLKKRNYVDIAFNTIEQEYGEISFKDLEQLRTNSYVQFNHEVETKSETKHYWVALDKCQEIINSWTKKCL
jgi:hypothetical protein